uniref:Sister chromatid cohesion protein PDS5 homolog A isoform X5 n=1 Tax=Rhizophora mucronata TaxID=61149 RepID=A0A2P2M3Q3_RHIMU
MSSCNDIWLHASSLLLFGLLLCLQLKSSVINFIFFSCAQQFFFFLLFCQIPGFFSFC